MAKKHVTFMIVTDTTEQPRSFRMPAWSVKIATVVALIVAVVIIYGAISYAHLLKQASVADDLQSENQILRDYTERMHDLERDLATNRLLLNKMMELAGIADDPRLQSPDDSSSEESSMAQYTPDMLPEAPTQHRDGSDQTDESVPEGIPMYGSVSRGFAPDESEGVRRHLGIDIAAREGTPIFATATGVVEFAGWDETFGNYLIIDHNEGYKTCYGHNRALLVSVGDAVGKGELIALSGNTGNSSAPHLHYEIRKNGQPVNPANYMDVESLEQVE
jgi:murein DD-endopeptidase MepM/ murein hydrolase activator NlpD